MDIINKLQALSAEMKERGDTYSLNVAEKVDAFIEVLVAYENVK